MSNYVTVSLAPVRRTSYEEGSAGEASGRSPDNGMQGLHSRLNKFVVRNMGK